MTPDQQTVALNLTVDNIYPWSGKDKNTGGMIVQWSSGNMGFGEITILKYKDGSINIQSEYKGKKFVKEVLDKLVDMADVAE